MPINFPTYEDIINRGRSSVRAQLPDTDPTVTGTFVRGLADGVSSRAFDIVLLLRQAIDQFFPQTATGQYIESWAGYEGLQRLTASRASGSVVLSGVAGTPIPALTEVRSAEGNIYQTQEPVIISANSFGITSINSAGSVATVVASGHPLASGSTVTISGAAEPEYNGEFEVSVIDGDSFSYNISGAPASPATGTIQGDINSASVLVESVESGASLNLESGAVLSFVLPISGADDALTSFSAITGGADVESDDDLRERVFQSRRNPVANFNAVAIEREARKISGVTRVFIKEIFPQVGDVSVYFLRDNDLNPLPSAAEISNVREQILTILPATSDEENVYVQAPVISTADFTFSAISPDTGTMREAIINSLNAMFEDSAEFEVSLSEDRYRSAIINTQDLVGGEALSSFTLTAPVGDITVGLGEIAGLGGVTFS